MRLALAALLAALPALGAAPEKTMEKDPAAEIAAAAAFAPPEGWTREAYANGADPVLSFRDGADKLSLRLFGGKGSAYKSPAEFLRGPAATTLGRAPEEAGEAEAAGRRTPLYRRRVPLPRADPHAGGRPAYGAEEFVILPAGKRFLVLAWTRESPVPDLDRRGEKAWKSLLKTMKLTSRKA